MPIQDQASVIGEEEMLREEWKNLFGKEEAPANTSGLCLSGGGIRSATFCLGVMQGLARAEKLQGFHYLSTVSGGGYAGSWLSRWRREVDDFSWEQLTESGGAEGAGNNGTIHPVRRLRSYSNYMAPTWGVSVDSLTVLTIFVRNLLFNLAVWVPVIFALSTIPYLLTSIFVAVSHLPFLQDVALPLATEWIFFGVPGAFGAVWLLLGLAVLLGVGFTEATREKISRWGAYAALIGLAWLLLFGVLIYLPYLIELNASAIFPTIAKTLNVDGEIALGIGGGAFATLIGLIGYWSRNGSRIKREAQGLFDKLGSQLFNLLGALAMLIIVMIGASVTHTLVGIALTSTETVAARVSNAKIMQQAAKRVSDAVQAAAIADTKAKADANEAKAADAKAKKMVAYAEVGAEKATLRANRKKAVAEEARVKADELKEKAENEKILAKSNVDFLTLGEWLWLDAKPRYLLISVLLFGAFVGLAWFISSFVGANRFSLHAMYGNRLTRAYLGGARRTRSTGSGIDFSADDDVAMASLRHSQVVETPIKRPVLFHIVNMTLNLTRTAPDRRDWQERKAAAFSATPLRCGSARSKYAPSGQYGGKNGLTLGRAMAISGAAATPNMGYHSAPFVTMVMTFFNIRLGWWLPDPDSAPEQAKKEEPTKRLWHMLKEALSLTDEKSAWMYLSDGGHFDNLGLYELIRRRCHRIVVVDGTCDGEYKHSDLHNAIRKVNVDFGIRIDLPPTLPGQAGPGEKQRVVVGKIRYDLLGAGLTAGEIICVKPILNGEEPPSLTHYAETSKSGGQTFPHHSTLDQFFNETQFESYRRLGEVTAEDLGKAIELIDNRGRETPPIDDNLEFDVAEVRAAYPGLARSAKLVSLANGRSTASKDVTAIEATPPAAAARGWEGLVAAVEAMSAAKLVTSTVVAAGLVGGALTVGGEVALKTGQAIGIKPVEVKVPPVEMNFSEEAKTLLGTGLNINTTPVDPTQLSALIVQLETVAIALEERKSFPDDTPTPNPALAAQIALLAEQITRLRSVSGTTVVVPANLDKQLGGIRDEIIAGVSGKNRDTLENIVTQLKGLERQVKLQSPIQNPSGK